MMLKMVYLYIYIYSAKDKIMTINKVGFNLQIHALILAAPSKLEHLYDPYKAIQDYIAKGERNIQTFYVLSISLERSQKPCLCARAFIWTIFWNEKLRRMGSRNNLITLEAHNSCSRKCNFSPTFAMMYKTKKRKKAPNHLK